MCAKKHDAKGKKNHLMLVKIEIEMSATKEGRSLGGKVLAVVKAEGKDLTSMV